ncbi:MAG: hypothetical protein RBR53_07845 [Desulforegulaceae bacterium]|nr:hypothetical protein [Desulforegulaceae bacterium]
MDNLKKNKIYINLLEKNGYQAYADYLINSNNSANFKVLENFIKIITKNKSSDEIKQIRNKYIKRFERKNI